MSSPASPARADEQTLLRGNKLLITIAAMIARLMAFLDISIVNVVLSDIRASFGRRSIRSRGSERATPPGPVRWSIPTYSGVVALVSGTSPTF
jgi:hypothetical protein